MVTDLERARARYEERFKAELDARSFIPAMIETGRQIGLRLGILFGRINGCQHWLGQSETPNEVLLAMPMEELERLAELLEQQLESRLHPPHLTPDHIVTNQPSEKKSS